MTEDQALSILRSRATDSPRSGLVAVRRFEPPPGAKHEAQRSLAEAHLRQIDLYGGGVLVNLMRAGGFVVLEFDEKSGAAIRFHLVTLDEAGKPLVQSDDIEGNMNKSEALLLLKKNTEFSDAFFNSPSSEMRHIAREFGETELGALGAPDGQGYFAIPEVARKLATRPEEIQELASLFTALQLWHIRHSLAMSVYAASPVDADKMAGDEQRKLVVEFLAEKAKPSDFIDHLLDLESIKTHDELATRLQWLRELNSFLDSRSPLELDSATYRANASISSVPLYLGVQQDEDRFYGVMTAPGLISVWTRTKTGDFCLKGVGEGE